MNRLLSALTLAVAAAVAGVLAAPGAIAEPRHGLSTFGELKYAPGFAHFEYVDPKAPKGGRISLVGGAAIRTFDSFNAWVLKGVAFPSPATETLMVNAADEPFS